MSNYAKKIFDEVNKSLKGKEKAVKKAVVTLAAGGHLLLEDVPGVGKTTLSKALAAAAGLETKRVQFTPDTLPSDITGFRTIQISQRRGNDEHSACGRDKPHFPENSGGSFAGNGGKLRKRGRKNLQVGVAIYGNRDAKSVRFGRHDAASKLTARPFYDENLTRQTHADGAFGVAFTPRRAAKNGDQRGLRQGRSAENASRLR